MKETKLEFKNMNLIVGILATFSDLHSPNIPISSLAVFKMVNEQTYGLIAKS